LKFLDDVCLCPVDTFLSNIPNVDVSIWVVRLSPFYSYVPPLFSSLHLLRSNRARLYEDCTNNTASNVLVEFYSLKTYYFSKSRLSWVKIIDTSKLYGIAER
jgi:hypothetical protein